MKIANLDQKILDIYGKESPDRTMRMVWQEMLGNAEVKNRIEANQCDDVLLRIRKGESDSVEVSAAEEKTIKEVLERMLVKGYVKTSLFGQLERSIIE